MVGDQEIECSLSQVSPVTVHQKVLRSTPQFYDSSFNAIF